VCSMRSLAFALAAAVAAGSFLVDVPAQPEAVALLATGEHQPAEADVLVALERGWWDAAKQMLRMMRTAGHAVGTMQEVRSSATRIRDQATDIINLMRVGANAEETVVNAAFQWAQRPDFIYLNVKFASRIDGPVTCLNVDNEKVTLTNNSLLFEAVGRQKPKTFRLNLTFNKEIDPEASTWSFASVGRLSFTIAKREHETWPRLLETKVKPKNMYAWYDRQTALDEQVKKEAKEKKAAATPAPTPTPPANPPPPPADGAPPPADGSPPPASPKPASEESVGKTQAPDKGKKKGKKKKKTVEEKKEL